MDSLRGPARCLILHLRLASICPPDTITMESATAKSKEEGPVDLDLHCRLFVSHPQRQAYVMLF